MLLCLSCRYGRLGKLNSDKVVEVVIAWSAKSPSDFKFGDEDNFVKADPFRVTQGTDARVMFDRGDLARWYIGRLTANRTQKPIWMIR